MGTGLENYVEAITSNIRLAILDSNFIIMWASDPLYQVLEYTRDEVIGLPFSRICPLPENKIAQLREGKKWSGEVKSATKYGQVIWFKSNVLPISVSPGNVASYLVINSNISTTKFALAEKEEAVGQLEKSEARYRALVENQSDLISLCDAHGNRKFVNGSYCHFLGKSFRELVGTNIKTLPFPGVPASLIHQVLHLSPENPEINGIFPARNSLHQDFWIDISIKGIFNTQNELEEILTIGRDVTKLKNAELQQTNYIRDLERIAFMTSHNVRGPIATMLGLIELLRMGGIEKDKWNVVPEAFKSCVNRLDTCTREMSDFIYQRQNTEA